MRDALRVPFGFPQELWQGLDSILWGKDQPPVAGPLCPFCRQPPAASRTFMGECLENTRMRGRGHFSEQSYVLAPGSSRQSLGHKKWDLRPGSGKLLRQGGAWRLGTIGIRHKGSGQGHATQTHGGLLDIGLLRTLQDLRARLPESILPSWASGDPSYSQKTPQAHQRACSKMGVYILLIHG